MENQVEKFNDWFPPFPAGEEEMRENELESAALKRKREEPPLELEPQDQEKGIFFVSKYFFLNSANNLTLFFSKKEPIKTVPQVS